MLSPVTSLWLYDVVYRAIGPFLCIAVALIGIRMLSYWWSFAFHWRRYRRLRPVTTKELRRLPVPFVKIQITTRGAPGSTHVILRGIRNVAALVDEDEAFYGQFLSVEVLTESALQARLVDDQFASLSIPVEGVVLPHDYRTPNGTRLKARALHYTVEKRREGWNAKPGRTYIVHYDEESVMVPGELRKLFEVLATTEKKVLEGPIYYPLDYLNTTLLCRSIEANRPIACFECRHVMEQGIPLHLHGSNLVIEETFENELGWDIGGLDGEPFIAEDYVFGIKAFLDGGPTVFGWHGCAMLEQPPFSLKSAFKQRHRWIFGVLQGLSMARRLESFRLLPKGVRRRLLWGTRYRILTFVLGPFVGAFSLAYLPVLLRQSTTALATGRLPPISPAVALLFSIVGALWLGSVFIGAWCNVAEISPWPPEKRWAEIAKAVAVAPVAGIFEGSAGIWAVLQWNLGQRTVSWVPTPKTKDADATTDWRAGLR